MAIAKCSRRRLRNFELQVRETVTGDGTVGTAKFVLIGAAVAVAWLGWNQHKAHVEARAIADLTNERGFIEFEMPQGAINDEVLIVAAQNCPKDGAVRADRLAREMAERSIRYRRSSSVSFSVPQNADVDVFVRRNNAIMNSEVPIVFINGKVKSNPGLDEVIAEYARSNPVTSKLPSFAKRAFNSGAGHPCCSSSSMAKAQDQNGFPLSREWRHLRALTFRFRCG